MAELVLHDLDPRLLRRLNDLASRSGRSVEQEAKLMLEESVGLARKRAAEAARRIRESHGRTFSDSADLIREDRER
jgi:plasmid stability protein